MAAVAAVVATEKAILYVLQKLSLEHLLPKQVDSISSKTLVMIAHVDVITCNVVSWVWSRMSFASIL